VHQRSHTDGYTCRVCEKVFIDPKRLLSFFFFFF
jgi:hypothetical protein